MSKKSILSGICAVIFLFSGSCDNGTNNPSDNPDDPTGTNDKKKVYGNFNFNIDQEFRTCGLTGRPINKPYPQLRWETVMSSGECALLKPIRNNCNCKSGEVCDSNEICQTEPTFLNVGVVKVTGYTNRNGTTDNELMEVNGTYQPNLDSRLQYPGITEGGTITLTAAGKDSVPGFTLSAKTFGLLEVADSLEMNPGKDITVEWKAAANPSDSKIQIIVDVSYHGTTKAKIECNCVDDGELVIPAALLDSLKTFGLAGHPKLEIYRYTIGTDPGTGVQLRISTMDKIWLKIPGVVSCDGTNKNCAPGQECVDQLCVEVK